MLKVIKQSWSISRASYQPQQVRREILDFLQGKLAQNVWAQRLLIVASELIANSCEHRFDNDSVEVSIGITVYRHQMRVQIVLDDDSNLLIMQRYKNLFNAVKKKNRKAALHGVHGRGLQIVLHWTDSMVFSKKRSGGLKIKVVKTVNLN